jgi:hypothetical protein
MALVFLGAWARLTPRFELSFAPFYQVAVAILVVSLAGAALQLSAYPGMGLKSSSIVGFWPSRLVPYTAYLLELTKHRFIATLVLPVMVLALMPLLVVSVLQVSSGWVVFLSCFSAATFGFNGFLAAWLALRLPKGSVVAGRGFQPYWKLPQ